jgi:nucleotide-binding universal stress UspA family protein
MESLTFMRMLVPTAGPTPAAGNAEYIVRMAKRLRAEVIVIHILDKIRQVDRGERAEGEKSLKIFATTCERLAVPFKTLLKEGDVVRTITEVADDEKVDLIVMGASEGRIVAQWIVADVLERTKVPVVIIPYGFTKIL